MQVGVTRMGVAHRRVAVPVRLRFADRPVMRVPVMRVVAMTVLVEATDGYRAAFSLAEFDPELTDRVILLADTKDSQPLPLREGPFRIIVPGEKRPARWVRQVKAVTVRKN